MIYRFDEERLNLELMTQFNRRFTIDVYNNCFNLVLCWKNLVVFNIIREHYDTVLSSIIKFDPMQVENLRKNNPAKWEFLNGPIS